MLQYTADYFNLKHIPVNFLQGHSQPTSKTGIKLKTCQFKAMAVIVFLVLWTPKGFPVVILTLRNFVKVK